LDSYNNVYITGYSMGSAADTDYATIKYNSSGELKWIARFNSPYALRDDPQSIALDNTMNVYVTGWSRGTYTNLDYATIKYIQGIEAPTQLSAYAISSSKIGLSWTDNSENETGFKIERTTTAGANWMLIGSVLRNHSTYTDSGLTANTTYHYRVYAYNPNGNSSYSNAAQATTLPIGIAKSEEVPDKFRLYMNYPNPFNPVTKISFDIPKSSGAKLVIYNISGKVMETLVNQKLSAGKYEVTWFAGNYSSGVYFCRIEAGNFTAVRKMVLVK
jgi:Fibronectin type III domain/Secretion system C-terminal sorting domain